MRLAVACLAIAAAVSAPAAALAQDTGQSAIIVQVQGTFGRARAAAPPNGTTVSAPETPSGTVVAQSEPNRAYSTTVEPSATTPVQTAAFGPDGSTSIDTRGVDTVLLNNP